MRAAAPLLFLFLLSVSFAGEAWGVSVDGPVTTKPVVFGNRVVVGTETGNVYAIENGVIKWSQRFNGSVAGDPAVLGENVIVATSNRIYSLNSAGGIAWNYDLRDVRGIAVSDKIYASTSRGVYAIDDKGKLVWIYNTTEPTEPSADLPGYVVFGSGRKIVALRNTGEKFWEREAGPFWNTRPMVWSGAVYMGTSEGDLYVVDVYSGEPRWVYRTGDMITSTPTHAGAFIIVGTANGWIYAINGGELAGKTRVDGMVEGEMSVDGNIVYFSTRKSLYGVSGSDGSVVIKRQFSDWPRSPAVVSGQVILGTQEGKVYAIDSTRACSILFPEPDALVGDADVEVTGKSYSRAGGARTFLRVEEGEWREVGGEAWAYVLDPSAYPFGVISMECYVSDAGGTENAPYNKIELIKGDAPKPKMKVRYPLQAKEGEPFNITVIDEDDAPLSGISVAIGGETFRGDGTIIVTPKGSGIKLVNVTKRGYEDVTFNVDVRPQPTLAYVFAGLFVAAAAAYAYFGYIKKR